MNLFSRNLSAFCLVALAQINVSAEAPQVGLSGPEVQKLDWNTRGLQAVDMNGDGLLDVLVANNDRATVDILYQLKPGEAKATAAKTINANRWEPVIEDGRFRNDRVTTGVTMYDLVAGDLNGDGRTDFAYAGDPDALTIRYQQEDGTWLEARQAEAPGPIQSLGSLRLGDLNGDKRTDLVMLGLKELAVFYQTATGELDAPVRLPLTDENCYGLELFDADGDGRTDIVYLSNARRDALRVRLQNAQGQFGPEQAYAIKDASSTLQILSPANASEKQPARLVFAQQRTGQLEFFNLDREKKEDAGKPRLRPRVFAPRASGKTPAAYAFGDYNGDGREDIAVSDADGAQVFIYFRQKDGGFTVAERFPSFADVRSLAACDWDGDGDAELIVSSLKEQAVGIASVNRDGRLDYPQPLPISGRPLALAAGDLRGKGTATLVVLVQEKGRHRFDLISRDADGMPAFVGTGALEDYKADPRGLRLVDANQDGLLDIAVFAPFDAMRLFVQSKEGAFTDASAAGGFRKGLVDNLDASAFTTGDVTGDGKASLLVNMGGFARAMRIDETGTLAVIDQFNARDATADIAATFVVPSRETKRPEVLLYDKRGEQFQRLRANAQGVYEAVDSIPVGRIDVVGTEVRTHGKRGRGTELFLLGKDRFWWIPVDRSDFTARSVEAYTTDLPGVDYADVIAGDLTGDGRAELVTLDPQSNVVEVLAHDESENRWQSRLHFKVFETDEHYQGRRGDAFEPREAIVADVTGDGRNDLLLLVHDRILVYPQL